MALKHRSILLWRLGSLFHDIIIRAVWRLRAHLRGTVCLRCCRISAVAVSTTLASILSSSLASYLVKDIVEALGGKGNLACSVEEESLLIAV